MHGINVQYKIPSVKTWCVRTSKPIKLWLTIVYKLYIVHNIVDCLAITWPI